MGIPKSDLLGVTVTLIHVAGQRFLTVSVLQLLNKSVISQLWQKIVITPQDILNLVTESVLLF